jgi:hypothetical protein
MLKKDTLEFVFLFVPQLIVFFFIIFFPFLRLLLIPILFGGCLIAGGIGSAAGIGVQFDGGCAAITFVEEYTINVMTFNTGHSNPPEIGVV